MNYTHAAISDGTSFHPLMRGTGKQSPDFPTSVLEGEFWLDVNFVRRENQAVGLRRPASSFFEIAAARRRDAHTVTIAV